MRTTRSNITYAHHSLSAVEAAAERVLLLHDELLGFAGGLLVRAVTRNVTLLGAVVAGLGTTGLAAALGLGLGREHPGGFGFGFLGHDLMCCKC